MKSFAIQVLLITTIALFASCILHPIHISYTRVEKQKNKILVASKIFSDDFIKQVSFFSKTTQPTQQNMQDYFNAVFTIQTSQSIKFELDSVRIKTDTHWLYFHANTSALPNTFDLKNSILCGLYDDQKNICIIKHGKKEEGYMFDYNSLIKSISITE